MGKYYLQREELERQVLAFQQDPTGPIKDQLAVSLYTLATNLVHYYHFPMEEMEDAVQDAVIHGMAVAHKFDPNRASVFNFLTTVMLNQMRANLRCYNMRGRLIANIRQKLYEGQ
jgi:DNA-directed RNA polymerase specialized sigma24 family protein